MKAETTNRRTFSDLFWFIGLSLLAWLHRAAFLLSNHDRSWPFTIFYQGDTRAFYEYALTILRGGLYDDGIPFHPPGFPYVLALVYYLAGADPATGQVPHLTVRLVMALVGSLSVGLMFVLVRPYLGGLAALLTAFLCLYHFGLYVVSVAPLSEGLYLALLLAVLLVWSRKLSHPLKAPDSLPSAGGRACFVGFGTGMLLASLALTRAEGILIGLFCTGTGLLGWWMGQRKERGGRRYGDLVPWAFLVAGWLVTLTPWTLYNAANLRKLNQQLSGRPDSPLPTFVPITIGGPINLALANHEEADGTFSRDVMSSGTTSGILDLRDPQHRDFLLNGHHKALRFLWEHPAGFLRLLGKKWSLGSEAANLGWTQWNLPGGLEGTRRPVDIFVPESGPRNAVLVFALVGLGICLKTAGGPRRWAWLVLALTAAVLATTGLFFGYARQWLLLLPFWFALIAAAAVSLAAWIRELARGKRVGIRLVMLPISRRAMAGFFALALSMLVLEGLGARADRDYAATGTTLPGSTKLNPDLPVWIEVLPPR